MLAQVRTKYFYKFINKGQGRVELELRGKKQGQQGTFLVREIGTADRLHNLLQDADSLQISLIHLVQREKKRE